MTGIPLFEIETAQFVKLSLQKTTGDVKLEFILPRREWGAVKDLGAYGRYLCKLVIAIDTENPPPDTGGVGEGI